MAGCDVSPEFVVSAARWLIWWPSPVAPQAITDPHRPIERLVLSPHPEDAWLGMGGRILSEPDVPTLVQGAFQVFTGALGVRFRTTRELAMACTEEAITAARLAAVGCGCFGIPEREARRLHRIPDDAARELLQIKITDLLADHRPREVFVPAALDGAADATLLLDAVLALIGDGVLEADVHAYEDAPSTLGERQVDDFLLRFEDAFVTPRRYYWDVREVMAQKETLHDVFACRLEAPRRRAASAGLTRNAQDSGLDGSTAAERFWAIGFAALE
jgi:hypothetical protein